jgi:hypothetical protein
MIAFDPRRPFFRGFAAAFCLFPRPTQRRFPAFQARPDWDAVAGDIAAVRGDVERAWGLFLREMPPLPGPGR